MPDNLETFRWGYLTFNVTAINHDLNTKVLTGAVTRLKRPEIEWYCEMVLGLGSGGSRLFQELQPVDEVYAKKLSSSRLTQPIVLAELSTGELAGLIGVFFLDQASMQVAQPNKGVTPQIIVIDGNHRIAAAYLHGLKCIDSVLLRVDQTTPYLLN